MDENFPPENPQFNKQFLSAGAQNNLKLPPVLKVILIAFSLFIAGQIVSTLLTLGIGYIFKINSDVLLKQNVDPFSLQHRSYLRLALFLSHIFSFILPAIFTLQYFYKKEWLEAIGLNRFPSWKLVGLSILFLLASIPLVSFSSEINKMIPLPPMLKSMESSTNLILKTILKKDFFYEIVLNVILIGIIPAIGEELMFRGVLQQQIGRLVRNQHAMVWITACIFSAIHFQFEGFLPRAILGAVLGYLFVWTKSIWLPMMAHLFNNAAQVIAIYVLNIKPEDADKIGTDTRIHWTFALSSIFFMFVLARIIQNENFKELS